MEEVIGDLWTYPAAIRCITTNGTIKRNGEAVMGRGCALEAKNMFPEVARILGKNISTYGNHTRQLAIGRNGEWIFSFPVKHQWHERADLALIVRSAQELLLEVPMFVPDDAVVVLPRPGCGNGQLEWEDVKPVLESILKPDRFKVITWAK